MTRPELTPGNYRSVYEYYETPRTNERWQRAVSAVLRNYYKPEVEIDSEARERLTSDRRAPLIVANHPSAHDPTMVASELVHQGMMPPAILTKSQLMARPRIPAVDRLVAEGALSLGMIGRGVYGLLRPDAATQWPPRIALEAYGSVPVFRPETYPDESPRLLAYASTRLIELSAEYLRDGRPVLAFPEGTLSSPESHRRLPRSAVKSGIARIALASAPYSYVLPVGIAHRERPSGEAPRHSQIVIGSPVDIEPGDKQREVQTLIHEAMQRCLDRAHQ